MTYDALQNSFGVENAIFSGSPEGVNWDSDNWDSEDFAANDIPDRVVAEGTYLLRYEDLTVTNAIGKRYVTSADWRGGDGQIENPTWRDLMEFLEFAMEETGDFHHSFLEGFDIHDNVIEIYTGS